MRSFCYGARAQLGEGLKFSNHLRARTLKGALPFGVFNIPKWASLCLLRFKDTPIGSAQTHHRSRHLCHAASL